MKEEEDEEKNDGAPQKSRGRGVDPRSPKEEERQGVRMAKG